MKDIGRRLKAKREELGLTMDQVQTETKIRRRHLESLEAGKEGTIPGEVYLKGFLRFYGNFLGLDGQALVAEYRQWKESQVAAEPAEPVKGAKRAGRAKGAKPAQASAEPAGSEGPVLRASSPPMPVQTLATASVASGLRLIPAHAPRGSGRTGRLAVLAAVLIVLVAAVGFWYVWSHAPSPSGDGGSGEPVAGGGGTTQPGNGSGGGAGADSPGWVLEKESAGLARYVVYGTPFTVRLEVVSEKCWMRVKVDGQTAFEGTVEAGWATDFAAKATLVAVLGRPHLVDLSLDGRAVGRAGAKDDPRTLEFEAGSPPGAGAGSGGP